MHSKKKTRLHFSKQTWIEDLFKTDIINQDIMQKFK
jgi:hypothetical protein